MALFEGGMPPLICECCGHTHEACTSSPPAAADTSQPCSYCCVPHYQRRLGLEWMYPASIPRLGGLFLKMVPELEGGMTGPAAMLGQALGRLIPNFEETVMMSSCIGRLDIEPRCSYKVEVNAEGKVQIPAPRQHVHQIGDHRCAGEAGGPSRVSAVSLHVLRTLYGGWCSGVPYTAVRPKGPPRAR